MSSFPPLPSLKFNPFGPEIETPPPTATTFSNSPRHYQSAEMVSSHLSNGPSHGHFTHHQTQSFNTFLSNSSPGTWTYNPAFGIIHTTVSKCSICTTYVEHVTVAMNNKDTTIAQAVQSRRDSQDEFFRDGYDLGSQHNGIESTRNLSLQLENALNALGQHVTENDSLRQELQHIKRQFAALEEDNRRLRSTLAGRTAPMFNIPIRLSPAHTGSTSSSSAISSSIGSFEDYCMQDVTSTSPDSHAMKSDQYRHPVQVEKPPRLSTASYAAVASTPTSQCLPTRNRTNLPPKPLAPRPYPSVRGISDPGTVPGNQHDRLHFKYPKSLQDLKDLMALAGKPTPEGAAALALVKKVCLNAHATPRESKTFIHKWVLINWRNPYATVNSDVSPADVKPNPRIDDPVPVWFDYLCTHPHSWPKGVRKDADGKPIMSDLIANRAVARMRPTESPSLRNDFIAQVTDMFSSPGMYQEFLEKNNFTVSPEVTYEAFTGPVTVESVALHFASSGFTPADVANNFEPWAKHYKEC